MEGTGGQTCRRTDGRAQADRQRRGCMDAVGPLDRPMQQAEDKPTELVAKTRERMGGIPSTQFGSQIKGMGISS
jgi:hypothetical protein